MSKMQAVVIDHSATSHMAIGEIDHPSPAPNEAIVKVVAVSLNLGEIRYAQSSEPGTQTGWDLAGTVEQAAPDGTGPKAGARVVGFVRSGAWAQYVAVPTNAIAELPENVSFEQAATLPVAGLTALYVLEKGHSLLDRNVLITGANGGVGLFACELASMMGAHPVALIRREQYKDLVTSHGAEFVAISEDGGSACEYGPYKLIAESVGGAVFSNCLQLLAPDGVCVTFGASAGPDVAFNIWPFMRTGRASLYGFLLFNELGRCPASVGLMRLADMVSEDKLHPYISVVESWSKVSEVVRDLWERKIPGKAVLRVD